MDNNNTIFEAKIEKNDFSILIMNIIIFLLIIYILYLIIVSFYLILIVFLLLLINYFFNKNNVFAYKIIFNYKKRIFIILYYSYFNKEKEIAIPFSQLIFKKTFKIKSFNPLIINIYTKNQKTRVYKCSIHQETFGKENFEKIYENLNKIKNEL